MTLSNIPPDLLSKIGHELRTQLQAILGFSEMGIGKTSANDVEAHLRYFNRINCSGQKLLALLNDFVDILKCDSGQTMLNLKDCSVASLIQKSLVDLQEQIDKKQANISMNQPTEDIHLECDPYKIERVLHHLIENAIIFGPQKQDIIIHVAIQDDFLRLTIDDQGPGIPKDERDYVFQDFAQLNNPNEKSEGSGLGLALVQRFVKYHQGHIRVEDGKRGSGCCFVVELPLKHEKGH